MELAEPGKPFNKTDAVLGNYSGRRLAFAAVSKDYSVIHYEHGGIAYLCPIVVFKTTRSKAELVGFSFVREALTDVKALRSALSKGRVMPGDVINR